MEHGPRNNTFLNLLEPEGLVLSFLAEPPEGFEPVRLEVKDKNVYGFFAELDLLTTADENIKKFFRKHRNLIPAFISHFLKPRIVFIGTTVSEYALFPDNLDLHSFRESALSLLDNSGLQFLIIKDMPLESPLLSDKENRFSMRAVSYLRDNAFFILYGQALAYVPVNFGSIEEYLQKLSRTRRKNLKRKLRSRSELIIEQVKTGDDFFSDANVDLLYSLYLNVYKKSEVHFDRLTKSFFRNVFKDSDSNGIVFLYRAKGGIIGFNLCFVFRDCLVDKYVGFLYPDSQDFNLYFVSWFYNLDFCIRNNLKAFIAGWTDPEIKSYLGAKFTYTFHAVYIKNSFLRFLLGRFKSLFESDRNILESQGK